MFMRMKRDIGSVSCTPNFRFECISQSGSHQIMLYCIGITGVGATSIEDYFAGQSFEQVDRILNWESHSEIVQVKTIADVLERNKLLYIFMTAMSIVAAILGILASKKKKKKEEDRKNKYIYSYS